MKKLFLYAMWYVLIMCSHVHAYIISGTQWQLPKQKITVLGDMHRAGELGKLHYETIVKAFDGLKQDKKRYLVILEASLFDVKQLEIPENRKKQNNTLFDLILFAYEHKNQYGNIDLVFGDIRGQAIKGWQAFHSFFHEKENIQKIAQLLAGNKVETIDSLVDLDELIKKQPGLWQHFNTIFDLLKQNHFWNISYLELLQEIRAARDSITAFMKKVGNKKPEFSTLKQYEDTLTHYFDVLKKYTTKRGEPFMKVFSDVVAEKQSFSYLTELFDTYFLPVWQTIADAGFLMNYIENQGKYDEVILVAGDRHAKAFNKVFGQQVGQGKITQLKEDLQGPLSVQTIALFLS